MEARPSETTQTPSGARPSELTLRGIVLGTLLTFVFTAANVYLGLKVGLTFASSIPAAVISMALLSFFASANIRENNIVQTIASAAGALASIIFVLPGLVIIGWWEGFPYWTSFLVCASGGILGVLFTIPLRRALVVGSDLPYPEGVAAAEVLKVGSAARHEAGTADDSREGLMAVIIGSVASAGLAIFVATRIAAGELQGFFRLGSFGVTGYSFALSLALFGAGHLVGLSVGMAMFFGYVIGWFGALPVLMQMQPPSPEPLETVALGVWSSQVRFLGAGTIAVAAVWTVVKLARPVIAGLMQSIAVAREQKAGTADLHDIDLSPRVIGALTVLCLAVVLGLFVAFASGSPLSPYTTRLILVGLPFVVIIGFLVAAVCGYMAGLIGSSNSPISGVGILSVVTAAGLLLLAIPVTTANMSALAAFALLATAVVFAGAASSNDNLQDLKTGQLVGATPWRMQVALLIGVVAAAAVIPPILNLLATAYGFAGVPNTRGIAANPLPAPQANLISALGLGVIGGNVNWRMIVAGAVVGVGVILLDMLLGSRKLLRLPPLAVGIGIYLPPSATLPVALGALIGWWYNSRAAKRHDAEHAKRLGVLVASGMIVGESVFGIVNAGVIVASNRPAPFALVGGDFGPAAVIGTAAFLVLIALLYGWMLRRPAPPAREVR
jgi:putative OPT family oligopeptide transporter